MTSVDYEAILKEKEQMEKDEANRKARNVKVLSFKAGDTYTRLLPPIDDSFRGPWLTISQHFGFLKNKKMPVTCRKSFDETAECPLCDYSDHLRKQGKESGNKEDSNEGWDKRSQKTHIAQMLKMDVEGNHDGAVYKVFLKETLRKKFLNWFLLPFNKEFADPINGKNLCVKRVGEDKTDTKYDVDVVSDKCPIKEWESIKSKMLNLGKLKEEYKARMYDTAQLKGLIDGTWHPKEDKEESADAGENNKSESVPAADVDRKAELERRLAMAKAQNQTT